MLVCRIVHSDMARLGEVPAEALHRDRVVLEPDPQLSVRVLSACVTPLPSWHLSSLLCRQCFHVFTLARLFQLARISCGFPSLTPSQSCGSAVWRSSQDAVMRDVHEHTATSL